MATSTAKTTPTNKFPNVSSAIKPKTLTDADILELFTMYGLQARLRNANDYAFVRKTFGNDPNNIKKVLVAEVAKLKSSPSNITPSATTNMSSVGKIDAAIKTATATANANTKAKEKAKMADYHLVQFTGDPNGADEGNATTIWLEDSNDRVLRPIMSEQALKDIYPDPAQYQEALASINKVPPSAILQGGSLANSMLLGADYGIYGGNKKPKELDFTPTTIQNRYGQIASKDKTVTGAAMVDKYIGLFRGMLDSGLDPNFLNKVSNDSLLIAGYAGAMGYGNYTMTDLWRDLKKKQAEFQGDKSLSGVTVIDQNINRNTYYKSPAGMLAANNAALMVPPSIVNLPGALANIDSISNNPQAFFDQLVPDYLDKVKNSPEYKAKMQEFKSVLHDSILNKLNANTVAEKANADEQWANVQADAQRNLGITLSSNALQAWQQVESLMDQARQGGIYDTGVTNEKLDTYLNGIRQQGNINRETTRIDLSRKEEADLKANASPEQIKKMNEEDAAKGLPREQWRAVKWDLAPDAAEIAAAPNDKNAFVAMYRSKYPNDPGIKNRTDAEIIDEFYSQYYDENGNKRSTLYQNNFIKDYTIKYGSGNLITQMPSESLYDYQSNALNKSINDKIKEDNKELDKVDPVSSVTDPKNLDKTNQTDTTDETTSPAPTNEPFDPDKYYTTPEGQAFYEKQNGPYNWKNPAKKAASSSMVSPAIPTKPITPVVPGENALTKNQAPNPLKTAIQKSVGTAASAIKSSLTQPKSVASTVVKKPTPTATDRYLSGTEFSALQKKGLTEKDLVRRGTGIYLKNTSKLY